MLNKTIRIFSCDDSHARDWNAYVQGHPDGNAFHWYGWYAVYQGAFNFQSIFLAAVNSSGEWCGILPLMLMRDFLGRKFLTSLPFSSYAGLLCSSSEAENALIDKAKILVKELNCVYLELRQDKKLEQLLTTRDGFVTMLLETDRSEQDIWKTSLKAKTRNQVRKAHASGLRVVWSKEHLDQFYDIFSLNMKRLGTPVFPRCFFSLIFAELTEHLGLLTIWHDDTLVAGMILLAGTQGISFPWAASLMEHKHLCPNNMLYWEAIRHASEGPYSYIDMGRSTPGTGPHLFKQQWGAIEQRLFYQYYYSGSDSTAVNLSNARGKYGLAIATWKKLPLFITRFLGPYVVRHLPDL